MRRRVPVLRSLFNAVYLLAKQSQLKAEAIDDSPEQTEAVEFLDSVLEEAGMDKYIEDTLSSLVFGWSWSEPAYGRRDPNWTPPSDDGWRSKYTDGKIGLRGLYYRRQSSFDRWEIDDATGRMTGFWQNDPPNPLVLLPLKQNNIIRGVHFVPFRDGDNPEGWPLLESCYEAYYYLKNYSVILGVGMERALVGWPVFEFSQRPSADDLSEVARAAGVLLAGSEKGYLSLPPGVKMTFQTIANPNAGSLLDIMKYYNLIMLQTFLADFIWMGAGETGSWSLGQDKSQLFIMAVNGVLDNLVANLNATVVPQLFKFNYPGLQEHPKLTHTGIHKPVPLDSLGSFISTISKIIPITEQDVTNIRSATDGLMASEQGEPFEPDFGKQKQAEPPAPKNQPLDDGSGGVPNTPQSNGDLPETEMTLAELEDSSPYDVLRTVYYNELQNTAENYLRGSVSLENARNDFLRGVRATLKRAYESGYGDKKLTQDARDWLADKTAAELSNARSFWQRMKKLQADGAEEVPDMRAWARTLDRVYAQARASATPKLMLEFVRGRHTRQPCTSCLKWEGKSHSAEFWASRNLIPGPGADLDCGGYNCGHGLVEVESGERFVPSWE